jgi:hypothetical protein
MVKWIHEIAPRANLKCFFKDGAISSGDYLSEVKEAASLYFC